MATPRLKSKYKEEVVNALKEKFQYKTVMQVPKLEKICINQGVGRFSVTDKKIMDTTIVELTTITGQQAVPASSKKDISNFKLRKGMLRCTCYFTR